MIDSGGKVVAQLPLSGKSFQTGARTRSTVPGRWCVHVRCISSRTRACTSERRAGGVRERRAELGRVWNDHGQLGFVDGGWLCGWLGDRVALDESNSRIYAVGSAGGVLGTDGRVWLDHCEWVDLMADLFVTLVAIVPKPSTMTTVGPKADGGNSSNNGTFDDSRTSR